jgi:hypothetical protein
LGQEAVNVLLAVSFLCLVPLAWRGFAAMVALILAVSFAFAVVWLL